MSEQNTMREESVLIMNAEGSEKRNGETRNPFRLSKSQRKKGIVYSSDEFSRIIERECSRADRFHEKLALAVFEMGTLKVNSAFRQLARAIITRFRLCDKLGMIGNDRIGIVMPNTPSKGALKVTSDIYNFIETVKSSAPVTLYSYPSDNWPLHRHKKFGVPIIPIINLLQSFYATPKICSVKELGRTLFEERDRADRGGSSFFLIVFDIRRIEAAGMPVNKLVRELNRELYAFETIGWFDKNDIGVLLPNAEQDHLDEIVRRLDDIGMIRIADQYRVQSYPDDWFADEAESSTNS